MENLLRYFFFDVLLSAGLPVAAAYIANWAVVNQFRVHDYLGDGQLRFYATTLSVVTTSGLFASKTASLTVKISAGGTMLWVVILANVVWAPAITARIRELATAELSKRRITGVSAALAGAAILPIHPLPDVARAMHQADPLCFTRDQESNHREIHEGYLGKVQHVRTPTRYFRAQPGYGFRFDAPLS